jgi:hypothetical protein
VPPALVNQRQWTVDGGRWTVGRQGIELVAVIADVLRLVCVSLSLRHCHDSL